MSSGRCLHAFLRAVAWMIGQARNTAICLSEAPTLKLCKGTFRDTVCFPRVPSKGSRGRGSARDSSVYGSASHTSLGVLLKVLT